MHPHDTNGNGRLSAPAPAAGHKWSASTINIALANLVAAGHLVNDNDKRGYGVPGGDEDAGGPS